MNWTLLLTAALVLVTILYAYFTYKILLANQAAVRAMREATHLSSRPYVNIDCFIEFAPMVEIVVYNSGKQAAIDVQIEMEPEPLGTILVGTRTLQFIEHPIAYLPPEKRVIELMGSFTEIEEANPQLAFKGKIAYNDRSGVQYREEFTIDLNHRKHAARLGRPDIGRELKDISATLENMARDMQRVVRAAMDK